MPSTAGRTLSPNDEEKRKQRHGRGRQGVGGSQSVSTSNRFGSGNRRPGTSFRRSSLEAVFGSVWEEHAYCDEQHVITSNIPLGWLLVGAGFQYGGGIPFPVLAVGLEREG